MVYSDKQGNFSKVGLGLKTLIPQQILNDTLQNERAFSGPNELREMALGISTIKFEYLHVLMVLLKSHSPSASLRLEAAREAISLLPSMVSNWTSVYNSMIWYVAPDLFQMGI